MTFELKLCKLDDSVGLILPKVALAHLEHFKYLCSHLSKVC